MRRRERIERGGSSGGSLRRSLSDTSVASPSNATGGGLGFTSLRDSNGFWKKVGLPGSSGRKEWVIPLEDVDLIATMGSGGTGEVWHAKWQGLDVAVKILYRQGGQVFGIEGAPGAAPTNGSDKVEKAFQAEVRSLSSLRHPNIVLFLGSCRSNVRVMGKLSSAAEVQYGIVTEYMSGGSLHDHVHCGNWVSTASPRLVRSIVKDVVLGMIYLHNEGIIHRDLKSRNILTSSNWRAKIADFDLSRIKQATLFKNDPSSSLVGTPSWMAPELIQGNKYDEKVDVYSFAVVLFEILSGEVPYASNYKGKGDMNHVRIVYDVVKHGARPVVPSYVSAAAAALISRCWSQDPRDRPAFSEILSIVDEENAEGTYFCHRHNEHLREEDEIGSISARSLGTASSASGSARLANGGGSSNLGSLREEEPPSTKEAKGTKFSKWLKKLWRRI